MGFDLPQCGQLASQKSTAMGTGDLVNDVLGFLELQTNVINGETRCFDPQLGFYGKLRFPPNSRARMDATSNSY